MARAAGDKLQRFMRDTRDAPSVEPNVQEQWLQVGTGRDFWRRPAPCGGPCRHPALRLGGAEGGRPHVSFA